MVSSLRAYRNGLLLALLFVLVAPGLTATAQSVDVFDQRIRAEVERDTVEAGRFDDGRMWTFDHPPLDDFEERYGFRPDQQWLRRARLGALRIPGCTASFVSENGLIMTNHHCARSHAVDVERAGEDLLTDGFYAESVDQERKAPNFYAEQLINIRDVSDRVDRALDAAETDAERESAREEVFSEIADEVTAEVSQGEAGYRTQIIPLYDGALHSAYTFRRYEDVRLAFVPELQLGYFGGDTDNFTYPRYALDMAIFRVYEDGEPVQPEVHFEWSTEGSRPGEAVFVVGNPGSTLRLETFSQLRFRRDVTDASLLHFLQTRVAALQQYVEETPDAPSAVKNSIFGLQNASKLYRGRVEALRDGYIMARIHQGEQNFADALAADSSLQAQYGGLLDSMARVQEQKRELAPTYQAFRLATNPSYSSATIRRAIAAQQYLDRSAAGGSGEQLESLRQQVVGSSQPSSLNRLFLTARLADFQRYFGADDPAVEQILRGRSAEQAAREILSESVLSDSTSAAQAIQSGSLAADDPAVAAMGAVYDRYRDFQSAWAGLSSRQADLAKQLGRARFAVYGHDVPPDATFSLRLADGVVRDYEYNGTRAPAYTTFFGLFEHFHAHGTDSEWDLPERWQSPPATFDMTTPMNMVSTNDITGGNSGSPVLNKQLKVVGLAFDGNIESLSGDFIFLPERGTRTVSVDVRGMLEALDEIYDADRLVHEVTGRGFVKTEAAAPEGP
ncbi:peptidase S46 [Longibacter salinarum]|uniref:Dipeptidyl-peptidase n=1 Tax=Longibacter salinarum TaxID=1850348 RepID=A0A2A8D3H9_9BACT|nr:S46 family peptidase [Longibacter salinarum]PEN15188.1 peptidase S46 [Longibacter salinarum]